MLPNLTTCLSDVLSFLPLASHISVRIKNSDGGTSIVICEWVGFGYTLTSLLMNVLYMWLSGKTVGIYAYNLHSLNKKNLTSDTPLNAALKDLILELNDSAKALVALLTKKFKTSS